MKIAETKQRFDSFIAYYILFFRKFLGEAFDAWEKELAGVFVIAVASFVISQKPDARGDLIVSLKAIGVYMLILATWHLFRTPWLLYEEWQAAQAATARSLSEANAQLSDLRGQQSKVPVVGAVARTKPKPRIRFGQWYAERISFNKQQDYFGDPSEWGAASTKYNAILLEIENAPSEDDVPSRTAVSMSARLVFERDSGDAITVSPAAWHKMCWGAIHLEVPKKELLILGISRDENVMSLVNSRTVNNQTAQYQFAEIDKKGIVEVQIVENGLVLTSKKYDYVLEGTPLLRPR